jgi:streptogramin lyase
MSFRSRAVIAPHFFAARIPVRIIGAAILASAILVCPSRAATYSYTNQADWQQGIYTSTNSDEPPIGHVKLNQSILTPYEHIWVSLSGRDSVVRIDTNFVDADGRVTLAESAAGNGAVFGEYLTRPNGMGGNPSRTTVDANGDVWVTNRNEAGVVPNLGNQGSVAKISANTQGITSSGIWNGSTFNRLDWPNPAGADSFGGVSTAVDDAILHYVRTAGTYPRHVSVDANNNVWVGGAPGIQSGNQAFQLYDGATGMAIPSTPGNTTSFDVNRGGYGGLVDGNGIVWSAGLVENSLVRFDPATGIATPVDNVRQSYGMGIDTNGKIWVSNWDWDSIQRFSPDGTLEATYTPAGMNNPRGVAVTHIDDNVWVANSFANTVSRLDNNGALIATVPVGALPTGVAVDAKGKVWVTNHDSHDVRRIDPATNTVDLIVELGPGASPYNYSDMTGTVLFGSTISQGTWRDVFDSGVDATIWDAITWNTEAEANIPDGTSLLVEARVSPDQITWSSYVPYASGDSIGLTGRYIELRATLGRNAGIDATPVLSDITLRYTPIPEPWTGLVVAGLSVAAFVARRRRRA